MTKSSLINSSKFVEASISARSATIQIFVECTKSLDGYGAATTDTRNDEIEKNGKGTNNQLNQVQVNCSKWK